MKLLPTNFVISFTIAIFVSGCTRELTECSGPKMNFALLKSIKAGKSGSGPLAYLIRNNPVDASKNSSITLNSPQMNSLIKTYPLFDLITPTKLESIDGVRIRLNGYNDTSGLAAPNGSGSYQFSLSDPQYWQLMAYFQVKTALSYVQALGFQIPSSRLLYAFANAQDSGSTDVNAYYEPQILNPSAFPTIKAFNGNGSYYLSIDGDIYTHETGHAIVYRLNPTFDQAFDYGALSTIAAGAHEAFADYTNDSITDQGFIATWGAKNFPDIALGQPLRSAEDNPENPLNYNDVMAADGSGATPERYHIGEWLSRVLWAIRKEFLKEDSANGGMVADRMIFTAISLMKSDSGMKEIYNALTQSDQQLHCGIHKISIKKAFEDRGYDIQFPTVPTSGIYFKFTPVGLTYDTNGNAVVTTPQAGGTLAFKMQLGNSSQVRARGVRVYVTSSDPMLHMSTYMQSYGDLTSGKLLDIGNTMPIDYSPTFSIDQAATGKTLQFQIKVILENGAGTTVNGQVKI